MTIEMQTPSGLPPRAISRPGNRPLFAWIGPDNEVTGLQSFEAPNRYPGAEKQRNGDRCLPVFGSEPDGPIDFDHQYFADSFEVRDAVVIRKRTVVNITTEGRAA